ncbi:MAG: type II toxin-antitoxin system RelE/ParE family toxin [Candidatus Dependentiae bacterium]
MKHKELIWIGSSKKDLQDLPDEVIDSMGYGLYLAQKGQMPEHAKVLKGFGSAGVIEIKDSDAAGTYRVVYTVTMPEVVFVLHAFQKKSKQGIKTPQQDIELIKSRLKLAEEIYKEKFKKK